MNKIPYKQIRAKYDDDSIIVYQAYNEAIANEAITLGKFGPLFLPNRMTWIKPSFLWMMYRSGWGKKHNQEHILSIHIKREAFENLVKTAMPNYKSEIYNNDDKKQYSAPNIRIQWDPERFINGNPREIRSIQIGIRGPLSDKYKNEWITKIEDITDYVRDLKQRLDNNEDISALLPKEDVYQFKYKK